MPLTRRSSRPCPFVRSHRYKIHTCRLIEKILGRSREYELEESLVFTCCTSPVPVSYPKITSPFFRLPAQRTALQAGSFIPSPDVACAELVEVPSLADRARSLAPCEPGDSAAEFRRLISVTEHQVIRYIPDFSILMPECRPRLVWFPVLEGVCNSTRSESRSVQPCTVRNR